MTDKRFVLLNMEDNIFVCCERVLAGVELLLEDKLVRVNTNIDIGHKIARKILSPGEKIIKYGAAIGSATDVIGVGEHVHMHNVKSDYIPSHTRQNKIEDK